MADVKKGFNIDKESVKSFPKKHPIIFHLLLIIITFFVILYATLFAIDSFTGHGIYANVPNVKGKTLTEAIVELKNAGFKWEVTDSTYSDTYKPGAVIEQEPKADSRVKPLRTIYLTMNAVTPRMVTVPMVVDMSYRQGMAMLEGLGFKDIRVETIFSPYKDLILDVKANGKPLKAGIRLPLNAKIEISVGNGLEEALPDSLSLENMSDSLSVVLE